MLLRFPSCRVTDSGHDFCATAVLGLRILYSSSPASSSELGKCSSGTHRRVQDADDENRGFVERAIEDGVHASEHSEVGRKMGGSAAELRHVGHLPTAVLKKNQIAVRLVGSPSIDRVSRDVAQVAPRPRGELNGHRALSRCQAKFQPHASERIALKDSALLAFLECCSDRSALLLHLRKRFDARAYDVFDRRKAPGRDLCFGNPGDVLGHISGFDVARHAWLFLAISEDHAMESIAQQHELDGNAAGHGQTKKARNTGKFERDTGFEPATRSLGDEKKSSYTLIETAKLHPSTQQSICSQLCEPPIAASPDAVGALSARNRSCQDGRGRDVTNCPMRIEEVGDDRRSCQCAQLVPSEPWPMGSWE